MCSDIPITCHITTLRIHGELMGKNPERGDRVHYLKKEQLRIRWALRNSYYKSSRDLFLRLLEADRTNIEDLRQSEHETARG